jgi:type IV pilus assembly protein PilV
LPGVASARARQRGVSMIEVLVSLFIVSLSVLALAGLVSASARFGKSGESRAVAALLAADLADRLRANPAGVDGHAYDWTPGAYPTRIPMPQPPGRLESGCTAQAACTPAEIAAIDLYRWRQRLYYSLPGGYGYVQVRNGGDASSAPVVDVWVAWSDATSLAYGETLAARECPAAFGAPGAAGTPRCLYLEVGP